MACVYGTGRRRRKRRRGRRGWGGNRTFKLGGGEQLRHGELLADEEEELKDKRLKEVDGMGLEIKLRDDEKRLCGAAVKEGSPEEMEGVEWGPGGAALVKEEPHEVVIEAGGLQSQVKAEMEEVGVGVKQEELELDEDAFSDDDLL